MPQVALWRTEIKDYPQPPFHPAAPFPELARAGIRQLDAGNGVYTAVREMLALNFDPARFGTPEWNPLGEYIHRGDRVVIKPNLVLHEFGAQRNAHCLTTHGSVIRAVLDYVYLAVGPEGSIAVADAPLQGADFARVIADAGLPQIQEFYHNMLKCEIKVIDLRQIHAVVDENSSLIRRVERLPGDPLGYCEIDLGVASRLHELDAGGHTGSRRNASPRYIVGDYAAAVTNLRHRSPRHSYVVSRTVLDANTVICVPKLKTHSKTGLTVCLKNMVGVIGSKDCLPHHRLGNSHQGGDEFPADYPFLWRLSGRAHDLLQGRVPVPVWRLMRRLAGGWLGAGTPHNGAEHSSNFFPSGGWHGNDTIWRTVDDLNRILFFYSSGKSTPGESVIRTQQQRRYFAVVDGITAMEGNGPLRGTPKSTGLIIGGDDPLAIDIAASTLMGFDWQRIPMLRGIAATHQLPRYSAFNGDPSTIELLSNVPRWNSLDALRQEYFSFRPPNGWRHSVEIEHVV
jgi:uncharacterized protein (DUF362 family)